MPTPTQISSEELKAMMEVQAKSTEQLVVVAGRLQTIIDNQTKIIAGEEIIKEAIQIKTPKEIVASVEKTITEQKEVCARGHKELETKLDKVVEGVKWVQIIFGSIAFLTAIAVAISQMTHWTTHAGK